MKKILSIACVALVVAALASCKKTYVTNVVPNQTWVSNPIKTADWALTTDGRADSVDLAAPQVNDFFNDSDATLVYFSLVPNVYEQIPEVYNGTSYSYIHYADKKGVPHVVLYAQPVNGGAPVKPSSAITVKLVLIPSVIKN